MTTTKLIIHRIGDLDNEQTLAQGYLYFRLCCKLQGIMTLLTAFADIDGLNELTDEYTSTTRLIASYRPFYVFALDGPLILFLGCHQSVKSEMGN